MKRGQFSQEQIVAILHEARVLVEAFRREYNEERPHQSLGYNPPKSTKTSGTKSTHNPVETNTTAGLKYRGQVKSNEKGTYYQSALLAVAFDMKSK